MPKDILQNIPEDVRTFTQETGGDRVQRTQEEIDRLEQEMAERQKTIEVRIVELKRNIEEKTITLQQALDTQNNLDVELTAKEVVTLGKIINIVQIRELKNQIGLVQEQIAEVQKEFDAVVSALQEAEQELSDRHELDEIEKIMSNFAQTETQLWQEHQERLKAKDVAEISRENNALFIHAFTEENKDNRGCTTIDRAHTQLDTRINIVLALAPDLSTSTIRLGDGHDDYLWGSEGGFILKGGSVTSASSRDNGTRSQGTRKIEDKNFLVGSSEDIKKKINSSINKDNGGYNELVVSRPEIGGFLINNSFRDRGNEFVYGVERKIKVLDTPLPDRQKIVEDLVNLGVPLYYQFKSGHFQKVEYNKDNNTFVFGEEVGVEDIQNNSFQLTEEQRQQRREEIFADCPFYLSHPEKRMVDGFQNGVGTYKMFDNPEEISRRFQGVFSSYIGSKNGESFGKNFGAPISDRLSFVEAMMAKIDEARYSHNKDFFELHKKLENIVQNIEFTESAVQGLKSNVEWYGKIIEDKNKKGDIDGVKEYELYIKNMQQEISVKNKEIEELKKEREKLEIKIKDFQDKLQEKEGFEEGGIFSKDINYAIFLYGFAEAARQAGDNEIYERAIKLAISCDPDEDDKKFMSLVKRRLGDNPDENSKFRITESDLDYISSVPT